MSTRTPSSGRGIPVELPDRLGEPLVIRFRPWGRPYLAHPDGDGAVDRPVGQPAGRGRRRRPRPRPAGVRPGDVRPRGVRQRGASGAGSPARAARAGSAVGGRHRRRRGRGFAGPGGLLALSAGAPTITVFWAGLVIGYAGAWVAARQLRRRADPRRRTRAALTVWVAVLAALGLYAALVPALLGS